MSLVDPAVKQAIHAPDKDWEESVFYTFGGGQGDDPSEWSDLSKLTTCPADTRSRSRVCLVLHISLLVLMLKLYCLGLWSSWMSLPRTPQPAMFP